jgi:hypothetical protein
MPTPLQEYGAFSLLATAFAPVSPASELTAAPTLHGKFYGRAECDTSALADDGIQVGMCPPGAVDRTSSRAPAARSLLIPATHLPRT